jgi:hypothetical protein
LILYPNGEELRLGAPIYSYKKPRKGTTATNQTKEQLQKTEKRNNCNRPSKGTTTKKQAKEQLQNTEKRNNYKKPRKGTTATDQAKEQLQQTKQRNNSKTPRKGTIPQKREKEQIQKTEKRNHSKKQVKEQLHANRPASYFPKPDTPPQFSAAGSVPYCWRVELDLSEELPGHLPHIQIDELVLEPVNSLH